MRKSTYIILGVLFLTFLACNKDQIIREPINDNVELNVPPHFPPPIPAVDNQLTESGIKLGRHLFYDPRLSRDSSLACAGCHLQEVSFGDFNRFSTGIDGIMGDVNAMPIINLAWQTEFFWNGRSSSLEEQAFEPVLNPIEMHDTWKNVVSKLKRDPMYVEMFEDAFGPNSIDSVNATKAIAQFERTLISANSKYDQGFLMQPQFSNFDTLEFLGYTIFNNEVGDCFHCHAEPLFGSFGTVQFSNNGLDSVLAPGSGREAVTGNPNDRGKFKIPSLRNIEWTFPYMHDGRFISLSQVIDHYDMGGHWSPTIDENMKAVGVGKNWSPIEKQALIAFMKTLTDNDFINEQAHADPFN